MAGENGINRVWMWAGLLSVAFVAGCLPVPAPVPPTEPAPTHSAPTPPPVPRKVEFLVFSAKWCSVCRDVPPVLVKLRKAFPDVTFRELDVDEPEGTKLSVEYEVLALPYYFVRIDGQIVSKRKGFLPYDHAETFLREAMKAGTPDGK